MTEPETDTITLLGDHVSDRNYPCIKRAKILCEFEAEDLGRIEFWSAPEYDDLYNSLDEAVDLFLEPFVDPPRPYPDFIELRGYARMRVEFVKGDTLDRTIEYLDEEYGDPDGDYDSPVTEKMYAAEAAYHKAIAEDYQPWACEPVVAVEVDLRKWHREGVNP